MPKSLSDMMDFDHVIQVHADGSVTDAPDLGDGSNWAPEFRDDELQEMHQSPGWSVMTGYTGQYGYNGPVMHNSEFIGGSMAADILATPGLYVALLAYWTPEDEDEDDIEGWVVAYRESE